MSIWDEITTAAEDYSLNDAKNGVSDLFKAYTGAEAIKNSSHETARAEQAAALYVPEVESQSGGDPVSIAFVKPQRDLVGDVPKDDAVIDKKWLYIGGGILALVLVGGIITAVKS